MADEWQEVQLGDVVDLLTGYPFKSQYYSDDAADPRVLGGDNIVQGALRWDTVRRWPRRMVEQWLDPYWLHAGDVVLAMDRPWIEAGLKRAGVGPGDLPALLVQRTARLRGTDRLDGGFLRYLIGSREFTQYVLAVQTGTAVPHISPAQIKGFRFKLPPAHLQRAIAHILGALDDKIDLNRRIAATLEEVARAVFKGWFVDFEQSNGTGGGASGPEMPSEWRFGALSDLAELSKAQDDPRSSPAIKFHHHSIPGFDSGLRPVVECGEAIKSTKFQVPPGAVLLSKLNPEIDRTWLVDVAEGERAIASTEFLVLTPRPPATSAFLYCVCRNQEFRAVLEGLVTGTSRSHQRAQPADVLRIPVVVPTADALARFDGLAAPLFERVKVARRESIALTELRDALLPRLISGELRLKDAEHLLGSAL